MLDVVGDLQEREPEHRLMIRYGTTAQPNTAMSTTYSTTDIAHALSTLLRRVHTLYPGAAAACSRSASRV